MNEGMMGGGNTGGGMPPQMMGFQQQQPASQQQQQHQPPPPPPQQQQQQQMPPGAMGMGMNMNMGGGMPQQNHPQQQQKQRPQQQQPQQYPSQHPPQTPQTQQDQSGSRPNSMGNKIPTPQSNPELDSKRVALILDINLELLRHAMSVHKDDREPANQEQSYLNCMKRLQCNLAYLASLADKTKALPQAPQCPQILTPPPEVASLAEPYRKLQSLFPEIMAYMQQQMALRQQQQQQQQQRPPSAQFMG